MNILVNKVVPGMINVFVGVARFVPIVASFTFPGPHAYFRVDRIGYSNGGHKSNARKSLGSCKKHEV